MNCDPRNSLRMAAHQHATHDRVDHLISSASRKMHRWTILTHTFIVCFMLCQVSLTAWAASIESIQASADDDTCNTNECIQISGKLWDSMNDKADPCEDFYEFSCGKYLKGPMPEGVDLWGHFNQNSNNIRLNLVETLKDVNNFDKLPAVYHNLLSFYQACLNLTSRDAIGYQALYKLINQLGHWPMLEGAQWDEQSSQSFSWQDTFIQLARHNLFFLIKIEATSDLRNTSRTIIKIGPPYKTGENIINLGPHISKTEYIKTYFNFQGRRIVDPPRPQADPRDIEKMRKVYLQLVREVHQSLNISNEMNETSIFAQADEIMNMQDELELRAAPIKPMSYYQQHYEQHLYTPRQIEQSIDLDLISLVRRIFFPNNSSQGFHEDEVFFVPDIDYLKEIGPLINQTSKRVLANYFVTNAVIQFAPHTTTRMMEMLVTKLDRPEVIDNVCFEQTALYLPELLGKLYVEANFDDNFKENISFVVNSVHDSFHKLLESSWMDETTKKEALDKLDNMMINVGYPEWFQDDKRFKEYCSMFDSIRQDDYFNSVLMTSIASFTIEMSTFSAKFNSQNESFIDTTWPRKQIIDVNAFYYFNTNGIYIPAGILQYPFYNKDVPLSVVFGSLGMIVGHEMTHAFDNSGRLYDKSGALRNWWTNETLIAFKEKSDCFIKQYADMKLGDLQVDSEKTVAENIADNAGLHEALQAFEMHMSESGVRQRLPGYMSRFTAEQLFFISFANMWCTKMNADGIEDEIDNDVHSPPPVRVYATLANSPDFARVFNCSANSRMHPAHKCLIY